MKISLCSYNIMSGCFDSYEETSKLTERFENLKKGIKKIDADFVGLVDTFKWVDTFTAQDLQKHFGYKNNFLINMNDKRVSEAVGVAVMTNFNVKSFEVVTAHNRDFVETTVNLGTTEVAIYTVYLDDLSEDTRLNEINTLLEIIKHPSIIHGDLNSFDIKDIPQMKSGEDLFVDQNPELAKHLMPVINDMKRGEVVEVIKKRGFIDAFSKYIPTTPSPLFPAKVKEPFIRVDYLFHSKSFKSSSTKVHKGNIFDRISDHYPISATLSDQL